MDAAQAQDGELSIRPYRPEDTERLVQITAEVFEPASIDAMIEKMLGRGRASWQEIKAQAVRNDFRDNPEGCFVAELDGRVVGYVTTGINRLASRGTIRNLAVSQQVQRRGIGRLLLLRALEYLRGLGLAQAKIETLACNEVGKHLYPSVGFRDVVQQIHYVMALR